MSLALDIDRVNSVLLADGWHVVEPLPKGVSSFVLDAYEYVWSGDPDESYQDREGSKLGWRCHSGGEVLAGPMSSLLAVKLAP